MQKTNYIQFKKQRELGDILTVTFKFIRENYKALFRNILKVTGPFFLIMVAALGYYTWSVAGSPFEALSNGFGNFIISFSVLAFALLLFYSALYGTVFHYIKSYVENDGAVVDEAVKQGVQEDFLKLLLLFFLTGILILAGLVLFVIPGIYVMVPLSLAAAILVFKRYSVTDAISYSFDLVKNHWWMTFLTLLVIMMLVYIIGLVFQIPLIIYMIVKTFTMVQEGSVADPSAFTDWPFLVLNVISSVIQYLLSVISVIAIGFIYFNLNEHKNLTGTFETIENLGN
ncbi:hypothetical protein LZ575_05245 [Antarcticibacterium sp. 1MA-6-2]|uniref:hypothetical protein n=1 Tax=Antarcticibacterium sp. 1MA-6-2 TaxID=2908210 RepID=UPI001F194FFD|nr:hypothetical protein [Antarcticibacterium sp. 1MA-6-2]UJH92020.1 hypothetical protein LZ575_05245 [Antarcticibacterium sp. 1MA-6-2]